jgi:hypothetical protein
MNACSLGCGVLARAQRLLLCSVGQGAPDRCHFHNQLIRYRPAQRLVARRQTSRAQTVVAAIAAQPVQTKSEMDPAVEVTVEKIHCTTARIVLFLGGGASQVGPAAAAAAPAACCCCCSSGCSWAGWVRSLACPWLVKMRNARHQQCMRANLKHQCHAALCPAAAPTATSPTP